MSIREGEYAPFDGDLFPPERSLRLGMRLEYCEEKATAKLTHATAVSDNELQRCRDKAEIRAQSAADRLAALQLRLDDSLAFYRHPAFVSFVAVVVTLAGSMAVGYIWASFAQLQTAGATQ